MYLILSAAFLHLATKAVRALAFYLLHNQSEFTGCGLESVKGYFHDIFKEGHAIWLT